MAKKNLSKNREVVVTGNWKMYKTIEEAKSFVETLAPLIEKSQARICLAVPFTAIFPTANLVRELAAPIEIGGQNMNDATEGAFTGEIAGKMLKDAGAQFVILGHSERRHLFHESNEFINKKVKRALAENLQPVLCIGETLEEREQGETEKILESQLLGSLEGIGADDLKKVILAYEPVWAIGTGKTAYPKDAQKAHAFIRKIVENNWPGIAGQLIIQYGGSVKPENAADLLAQEDIDGLLVGGASLSAESFSQIVNTY